MIVIFEGPQGVGKTTLIEKVDSLLDSRGFESVAWKVPRGTDPIKDMNDSLDHEFGNKEVVYLLDRFHLSEWVIYYYTGKWANREQWWEYAEQLQAIDVRLREMGALIVFITTEPEVAETRLKALGKEDILGNSEEALRKWYDFIHRPKCELIHLVNDDVLKMNRNAKLIADIIRSKLV
jgi:thymidylate kinase